VWRHIYELQLSQWERDLLTTFFSMQKQGVHDLEKVLLARPHWSQSQVRRSLQVLDGTFLNVRQKNAPIVEFHNPSASEFVGRELFSDPSELAKVLSAPHAFEQIEKLWFQFKNWLDGVEIEGFDTSPYSTLLATAVIESIDSIGEPYKSKPSSSVVRTSLEVAEFTGHRRLTEMIVKLLSTQGTVYRIPKLQDIVEVIRLSRDSRVAAIRACHNAVRLEGMTAILNREKGRGAPVKAALYAMSLPDLIDHALLDEMTKAAAKFASQILQEYEEHDLWGGDLDFRDVEAAVQFSEIYEPQGEVWSGWGAIMADLGVETWRGIGGNDEDLEDEDYDYEDEDDNPYEGDKAYELMQSLSFLDENDRT
jgi:hypothetical protein